MDSLLQEITLLPGVLGCFVFNNEQQIVGSKMPPIFREKSINTIGNLLARTVQIGNMAQLDFKTIEIKFNESLLVIQPLARGALLVMICEPNANKSLIGMTTGMLAEDITKFLANPMAAKSSARQTSPGTTAAPQQKQPPSTPPSSQQKEAVIDAALAPILEKIKDALAMAIGPIAAPVMRDTIDIWANEGNTSLADLPELISLLCIEIDDTNLEKDFRMEIKTITT